MKNAFIAYCLARKRYADEFLLNQMAKLIFYSYLKPRQFLGAFRDYSLPGMNNFQSQMALKLAVWAHNGRHIWSSGEHSLDQVPLCPWTIWPKIKYKVKKMNS